MYIVTVLYELQSRDVFIFIEDALCNGRQMSIDKKLTVKYVP